MSSPPAPFALVVGGTGKVGSETAASLLALHPSIRVVIAGRNRERGDAICATLGPRTSFARVDLADRQSIMSALRPDTTEPPAAVVVHCAGPFTATSSTDVLTCAVEAGVPYLDVCDDEGYGLAAKNVHKKALEKGVPCITTGGLFPGLSNVIARELAECVGGVGKCQKIELDYWCAGTGGLGPTVLTTSFFILSRPATNYRHGTPYSVLPMSLPLSRETQFPDPVGKRRTYPFDLPEVHSLRRTLGVPSVEARFSVAPDLLNGNMRWAAENVGHKLANRDVVDGIVRSKEWYLRWLDWIVGTGTAMSIRASTKPADPLPDSLTQVPASDLHRDRAVEADVDDTKTLTPSSLAHGASPSPSSPADSGPHNTLTATYYHASTSQAIARCVAAMAIMLTALELEGEGGDTTASGTGVNGGMGFKVKPGVHYPEEALDGGARKEYVKWATGGGAKFEVKSDWW